MILRQTLVFALFFTFLPLGAHIAVAQVFVRSITIKKLDVFDTSHSDWFFGARLLNSLHTTTRDHVIDDELLVSEGDELDEDLLDETVRNLRRRQLFSAVDVRTEDVSADSVDVVFTTRDKWSTLGEILYGTGGGNYNYGGSIREENFLGEGINTGLSALYRTENSIGWQGFASLFSRRFLRSEMTFSASLLANSLRTVQTVALERPFLTMRSPVAYGISATNSYGDDFFYDGSATRRLPYHVRRVNALYAKAAGDKDRFFWSLSASLEDVQRLSSSVRQAFDNSGRILFSLGSLRQSFVQSRRIDGYEVRDVAVGAWGQAVFGYLFPMRSGGERLVYVGARAEQSTLLNDDRLYLYGSVEASSAFSGSEGKYTYVESMGTMHYRSSATSLITARFLQQTAWNWSAFRQLVLDNDMGLRGYVLNGLSGENRFLFNTEFRVFPEADLWILRMGLAAFYDCGTVWNQAQDLRTARFRNSVGVGFRIFNTKLTGSAAILRIDFAYNMDEKRWAGIIITSDQLFSAFGSHAYKAPYLGGTAIDNE